MQNVELDKMNIINKLDKFWFMPLSPDRLSIFRIMVGIYAFYLLSDAYILRLVNNISTSQKPGYLFDQVGIINLIDSPLDPEVFKLILLAAFIFNILFILGLLYRISGPVFALLFLFLISYSHSWSMIYHSRNIAVLHCLVLGFTLSADSISLDSLIKNRIPGKFKPHLLFGNIRSNSPGWQYGWPIMLINSMTVVCYFIAGIAKIMGPVGIYWVLGESVRSQVAVDAIRKEFLAAGAQPLSYLLYNHVYIFTAIGISTIILELGAPFAVINKRIGYIWSLLTLGMHWGIYFIMGITFRYQMAGIIFLPFFPIEKISSYIRKLILKKE